MQMSELMMSSPHCIPLILFTEWEKSHISAIWESRTCLIFTLNKCRIMSALICFSKRIEHSQNCVYKILWTKVRRLHHQLAHWRSHIDCSRNDLLEITKIRNNLISLFFNFRFTSNFHCSVEYVLLFLCNKIKFGLDFSFNKCFRLSF